MGVSVLLFLTPPFLERQRTANGLRTYKTNNNYGLQVHRTLKIRLNSMMCPKQNHRDIPLSSRMK